MDTIRKKLSDYGGILLGAALLSLGINLFLSPARISTGGFGGVAITLYHWKNVPLALTTLVLNLVLFGFALRVLSRSSLFKSIAGILFLSLFLSLTSSFSLLVDDRLLATLFGGVMIGLGGGITLLKDGSTGGSDLLALIVHRRFPRVGIVPAMLAFDGAVILVSSIVFSDPQVLLYSVFCLYLSGRVTDAILVRGRSAKVLLIVSRQQDRIASFVMTRLKRGVTGLSCRRYYTATEGEMLLCVVSSRQVPALLKEIRRIDENAFTVIFDAREVRGLGFLEK